jgi:glycosyltransferase involved in cell wall biosynthesis
VHFTTKETNDLESRQGSLPSVSVIVPVRNMASTLEFQLRALSEQDYNGPLEVVVADNGSTDGSATVAASWPKVRVVDGAGRIGPNPARNAGARAARGDLILVCDADDIVAPNWVSAMVRGLALSHLVGGRLDYDLLNPDTARRPRGTETGLPVRYGFLPTAIGANFGIRASTLATLGYWDEDAGFGTGDTELCWRAQLAGFTLGFVPDAVVHKRMRAGRSAVMDQAYRGGVPIPYMVRRFREKGMPLRGVLLEVVKFGVYLVLALPAIPFSRRVRLEWLRRGALAIGVARGLLASRESA